LFRTLHTVTVAFSQFIEYLRLGTVASGKRYAIHMRSHTCSKKRVQRQTLSTALFCSHTSKTLHVELYGHQRYSNKINRKEVELYGHQLCR
jgi:hypothetical protein